MARLLIGSEWFEQITPGSLYESEYERIVLQQASLLYPDYYAIPFKMTVYTDDDSRKPDMILVHRAYKDWWVVEVEMEDHSLDSHIIPQVRTLGNATYGESVAKYIWGKQPQLDLKLLKDMLKGKPPRVLVVVNASKPEWVQPLERYDAYVATLEIYRSDKNVDIYRINGFQIADAGEQVSRCYFDSILPNFLVIESPASLGIPASSIVKLGHENSVSDWKRLDSNDRVWLVPVGANPLSKNREYNLFRNTNNEYVIVAGDGHTGKLRGTR